MAEARGLGDANDIGGTLMNESISRASGASHRHEISPAAMATLAASIGRSCRARTTLYGAADPARLALARDPAPLAPVVQTPPRKFRILETAE